MNKVLLVMAVFILFLSGCATVPMGSTEDSKLAKEFNSPGKNKAGVYIYRKDTPVGLRSRKVYGLIKNVLVKLRKGYFSIMKLTVIKSTQYLQSRNFHQTT